MNRHTRTKGSRRTICSILFLLITLVVVFLLVWRPLLLVYSFKYAKIIISEVVRDNQRFLDNELELANKEWRLYQMESRFGQEWCQENEKSRKDVTWLTVLVNDAFAVPALVLGYSIQKFSCQKNMIALISDSVSEDTRTALQRVGWSTRVVQEMDCNWFDSKMGVQEQGFFARPKGYRIKGTHTRFHAWNYTQFSKIVYADADYMLMTNIDELFDVPDDFAAVPCARPGVVDPCFNAGLLVFRPDSTHYQEIMNLWLKTTQADVCPNDQVLLWHYYADNDNWKALPFAFNVRRIIYRPMKGYHFACCIPPKPWSAICRPNRKEAKAFNGPILKVADMAIIFWKNFYELLSKYDLDNWWRSTAFFKPLQEFGESTSADCWIQQNQ